MFACTIKCVFVGNYMCVCVHAQLWFFLALVIVATINNNYCLMSKGIFRRLIIVILSYFECFTISYSILAIALNLSLLIRLLNIEWKRVQLYASIYNIR